MLKGPYFADQIPKSQLIPKASLDVEPTPPKGQGIPIPQIRTNHKHPNILHSVGFKKKCLTFYKFFLIFHISGTNRPTFKIQKAIQVMFQF